MPPPTVPAESRTTNLTGCSPDGPSRASLNASNPRTTLASSAGVTFSSIIRLAERSSSELFKNIFRFLGIVTDDRQLDQIIRDPGYVNRLEVDARFAESVRDIGQRTRFVLEQDEMDLALREPNVRRLERATRYRDIVRENARHRHAAAHGYSRERFDVDATAGERLRHSGEVAGVIRQLDGAVSH